MKRGFWYRVINVPKELQTALVAALLVLAVQLENLLEAATGWDFGGVFQPLPAVIAVVLAAVLKVVLENVIPEKYHNVVNQILIWIAGFFAAQALLK